MQALHHRRHTAAEIKAEGNCRRVFRARERCGGRLRGLVRLIIDPCGLVSGRFTEDVLPGSLRQIDVIINIVFKHSLDGQLRPAHIARLQDDGIARRQAQRLRKAPADDAAAVLRVGDRRFLLRVQVDKAVHAARFRADDVCGLDRAAGRSVQTFFRDKQTALRAAFLADGEEVLAFAAAQRVLEGHGGVIAGDLVVLIVDDAADGVLNAEARDEQRRAAADANHHHDHALFKAQNVPDGDFMQEGESVPEQRKPFEQNALARLRRSGADQLRCRLLQLGVYDVPRRTERAQQICARRDERKRPVKGIQNAGKAVHDVIGVPDHLRQEIRTCRDAEHTAENRGDPGIEEVLGQDRAVGIPQRL